MRPPIRSERVPCGDPVKIPDGRYRVEVRNHRVSPTGRELYLLSEIPRALQSASGCLETARGELSGASAEHGESRGVVRGAP